MESRVKAALFSYSEERRDDPDGSQMVCEKVLSGKKLKASIEEHGIITPVIAFRNEEGETRLDTR